MNPGKGASMKASNPIVRQLIKAYDDYLALLKMGADSMISVAFVHGWRSCFVEEGKAHRAKIEKLKFALDYEKQGRSKPNKWK